MDDVRARIERCRAAGEAAYDQMYESRDRELSWQLELSTDAFREAYRIAVDGGLSDLADEIMARLQHVKAVGRQLR